MTSLKNRTKRIGLALALMLGLTILSGVVEPLVGDEMASWLPSPDVVLADKSEGSGG